MKIEKLIGFVVSALQMNVVLDFYGHFDRHYYGKYCLTYCFNKPEDK
jgi:hypothetical protein